MGQLVWLSEFGDETVEWNPDDSASIAKAHERFKALKKEGFEFFEIRDGGRKRVGRWNAKLGRVLAVPGIKKEGEAKEDRPKAMAGGPNAYVA